MSEPSRRSFLRLGGLATGGLILPWAGNKAFALAEPASAAELAVVPTAFPVSADLRSYRTMIRAHAQWRLEATIAKHKAGTLYGGDFHEQVRHRSELFEAHAAGMWARPVQTWGDVAALAEIAWGAAPKAEPWNIEVYEPHYVPPRLARSYKETRFGFRSGNGTFVSDFALQANGALIEAVLTMAGGQRYDPFAEFNWQWEAHQTGTVRQKNV